MAKLHKRTIPFTQVANEVINDTNLSWKAKGLFSYLFSKPEGWDFSGHRMKADSADGRDSTFSGLKELEDRGYLTREKGNTGRVTYTLKYSVPDTDNKPKSLIRKTQIRKTQIRKTRTISNKDINNKDINNKELKATKVANPKVSILIDLFKEINPSYQRLFQNKTQRAAAERLIDKYGWEKMENTVKALPQIINKPYAPVITTPYELENKLAKLVAFASKEKVSNKIKSHIIS